MTVAVEDLLNLALRRVGYPTPIGNIMEGSRASRVGLEIYVQTRDNLFGERDWPFLRQQIALGSPIKTAPPGGYPPGTPWDPTVNPPLPWVYEYTYPTNCIEIRSLRPISVVLPEFTPQYTRFTTGDDPVSQEKVVLTDLNNAMAVITGRVTDPNEWNDSNFSEALINALAEQFQKFLGPQDVNKIAQTERDTELAVQIAQERRG